MEFLVTVHGTRPSWVFFRGLRLLFCLCLHCTCGGLKLLRGRHFGTLLHAWHYICPQFLALVLLGCGLSQSHSPLRDVLLFNSTLLLHGNQGSGSARWCACFCLSVFGYVMRQGGAAALQLCIMMVVE